MPQRITLHFVSLRNTGTRSTESRRWYEIAWAVQLVTEGKFLEILQNYDEISCHTLYGFAEVAGNEICASNTFRSASTAA